MPKIQLLALLDECALKWPSLRPIAIALEAAEDHFEEPLVA
jgi:hypothetical protein